MRRALLTYDHVSIGYGGAAAVCDVSFAVHAGEIISIVGESGSGKSTLLKAALGLLGPSGHVSGGHIWYTGGTDTKGMDGGAADSGNRYAGNAAHRDMRPGGSGAHAADAGEGEGETRAPFARIDLTRADKRTLSAVRGRQVGMVFQDSRAALTPTRRVGDLFFEEYRAHRRNEHGATLATQTAGELGRDSHHRSSRANRRALRTACDTCALEILERLNVPNPPRILQSYPFQLSGGIGQRVGIALALLLEPLVLLADEPTSALDAVSQSQVAAQLRHLADRQGMGIVLITHNIGLARAVADTVVVLKDGVTQESGPVAAVLAHPQSAYTRQLLDAVPVLSTSTGGSLRPFPNRTDQGGGEV